MRAARARSPLPLDDDDKFMQALPMFERAMVLDPTRRRSIRAIPRALAASGLIDEARKAGLELLRVHPKFSAIQFAEGHAFKDPAKRRLFGEHLVRAGLPKRHSWTRALRFLDALFQHGADRRVGRQQRQESLPALCRGRLVAGGEGGGAEIEQRQAIARFGLL